MLTTNRMMDAYEDGSLSGFLELELANKIGEVSEQVWGLTERELRTLAQLSPVDYSLRTSFWRELEKAIALSTKVKARDVYGGVCTVKYWKSRFLADQFKLAWICKPLQNYDAEIQALLSRGTERLWELVDLDTNDPRTGVLCTRRAAILLETVKMIEARAKGLAVQRVQAVNVNVDAANMLPTKAKEIDQRIRELEAQLNPMLPETKAVEVTIIQKDGTEEVLVTHE